MKKTETFTFAKVNVLDIDTFEIIEDKKVCQDGFVVQANRLEQNRDRHLAAAVDAEVQNVFRIELEVQP